ncbi:hypothetical protein GCM10023177_13990 [Streptomyces violaceoruber]
MDRSRTGRAGRLVPYGQAGGDVEEVTAHGCQLLSEQPTLDGGAALDPVRGGDAEEDGLPSPERLPHRAGHAQGADASGSPGCRRTRPFAASRGRSGAIFEWAARASQGLVTPPTRSDAVLPNGP